MFVKQVMTSPVRTVGSDDDVSDAWNILRQGGFRHLPVVRGDTLVGMLSDRDVEIARAREWATRTTPPVRSVMRTGLVTVEPTTPIEVAARLMLDHKIGALPVLSAGRLVGIVTQSDLFRVLADSPEPSDSEIATLQDDRVTGTSILVPLDGSALAERAVPYAAALARALHGRLILMHAGSDLRLTEQPAAGRRVVAELNTLANAARREGLEVEECVRPVHVEGAGSAIAEAARERCADVIVMSTNGRAGLGRWIYGSVADQVLRRAETPVLLVPGGCDHPWPIDRRLRILVALDGSALAEEALGPAARIGRAFGAELLLLRVVDPTDVGPDEGDEYARLERGTGSFVERSGRLPGKAEAALADARQYLEAVASRLRSDALRVDIQTVIGKPTAEIAGVARLYGADLVAIGTHGEGGLARLVLGSVATGVLQRASAPLLVRPAAVRHSALKAGSDAARPALTAGSSRSIDEPPSRAGPGTAAGQ